jgi:predicted lactoylglutathione lyase
LDERQGAAGHGDQAAATGGNGTMVALAVGSPDDVKKMHAKAMALGGKDEGAPGFRPAEANSGFYGGYFRDLDGNKFVAFCMVPKA